MHFRLILFAHSVLTEKVQNGKPKCFFDVIRRFITKKKNGQFFIEMQHPGSCMQMASYLKDNKL